MMPSSKKIAANFYQTLKGNEPVREWLLKLDVEDRKIVGKDIQKIELSWPIGMPYSRSLGQGLYEVRSNISDKRIARVLFFVKDNKMVLLHGFVKTTQKNTKTGFRTGGQAMKEIESHD